MKNYEKYADKIREYEGDSICTDFIEPYILKSINAKCTNTGCVKCQLYRTIWLLEDYEPEINWNKVEVDTPILVRATKNEEWSKRYFAKYENGYVHDGLVGAQVGVKKMRLLGNTQSWQKVRKSDGSKRICNEKGIR